jgi:hypothetical protein
MNLEATLRNLASRTRELHRVVGVGWGETEKQNYG